MYLPKVRTKTDGNVLCSCLNTPLDPRERLGMLAPDWSMAVSPANQRAGRSLSVTGSDLDLNQGNVLILI